MTPPTTPAAAAAAAPAAVADVATAPAAAPPATAAEAGSDGDHNPNDIRRLKPPPTSNSTAGSSSSSSSSTSKRTPARQRKQSMTPLWLPRDEYFTDDDSIDDESVGDDDNDDDDGDAKMSSSKHCYYALRPSFALRRPVIFFGRKDLKSFLEYAQKESMRDDKNNNDNNEELLVVPYKTFDKLVDALTYIMETPAPSRKAQQPPSPTEKKRHKTIKLPTTVAASENSSSTGQKNSAKSNLKEAAADDDDGKIGRPTRSTTRSSRSATAAATKADNKRSPSTRRKKLPTSASPSLKSPPGETSTATRSNKRRRTRSSVSKEDDDDEDEDSDYEDKEDKKPKRKRSRTSTPSKTDDEDDDDSDDGDKKNLWDRRWEERFELLKDYKVLYGDCNVPRTKLGPDVDVKFKPLVNWVKKQRESMVAFEQNPNDAKLRITEERVRYLLNLGVVADPEREIWDENFQLLKDYKTEYGDCLVPGSKTHPNLQGKYKPLRLWVPLQRDHLYTYENHPEKSGRVMTAQRRRRLLDIGFVRKEDKKSVWGEVWEEKFELLGQFKQKFGHCRVQHIPDLEEKFKPLVYWVKKQRENLKAFEKDPNDSKLNDDKRQRLLEIGLLTDVASTNWEERFQLLQQYKDEFGDCNVPVIATNARLQGKYSILRPWACRQREELRAYEKDPSKSKLTPEKRQLLLDLGFKSKAKRGPNREVRQKTFDETFRKKVEELKAFKEANGHLDVPPGTSLSVWMWKQRRNYVTLQEGGDDDCLLKLEHIIALTNIGFAMTHPKSRQRFDPKERVDAYVDFVKKHGRFPSNDAKDDEERKLGQLGYTFRKKRILAAQGVVRNRKFGRTEMPQEQIDALDAIGFNWEVKANKSNKKRSYGEPFEKKFERLKAYKAKHGHCEPPKRHPKLGAFVFDLRRQYKLMVEDKKSRLTLEQFRMLSEFGFRFKPSQTGISRKRYVEDGSSGYDTSSDEEGNNNKRNSKGGGGGGGEDETDEEREVPNMAAAFGTAHRQDGANNLQNQTYEVAQQWMHGKSPRFGQYY